MFSIKIERVIKIDQNVNNISFLDRRHYRKKLAAHAANKIAKKCHIAAIISPNYPLGF